jgi:hypothetical protein
VLILVIPLYVLLQVVVLYQVRGLWRWAAALPLVGMLPLFVLAAYEYSQQSELWPLMLVLSSPVAIVWLLIIAGLFYWINRRTGPPS